MSPPDSWLPSACCLAFLYGLPMITSLADEGEAEPDDERKSLCSWAPETCYCDIRYCTATPSPSESATPEPTTPPPTPTTKPPTPTVTRTATPTRTRTAIAHSHTYDHAHSDSHCHAHGYPSERLYGRNYGNLHAVVGVERINPEDIGGSLSLAGGRIPRSESRGHSKRVYDLAIQLHIQTAP